MKFTTVFLAVLGLAAAAPAPAVVTKKNALGDRIKADIEARTPIGQFIWQWYGEDDATEEDAKPSPEY
ncbi:hypothetical protein DPSP01_005214 [Paraphaeosphaeria sporulosa]|uniref:Uncharacterized protein n=1 Tax=Paraphaeosphaeria sporulosa TaxID=1460663 RepID=A0A177BWC7_9PLEO|nr:uncharacterized protein CC84DRAFT_1169292 [Paraphaeosphaeria sporulosa]OAF99793.1 hypothetical protein CC84DRAFT_1169292 [Paraphaeosphaeria sporulosa]